MSVFSAPLDNIAGGSVGGYSGDLGSFLGGGSPFTGYGGSGLSNLAAQYPQLASLGGGAGTIPSTGSNSSFQADQIAQTNLNQSGGGLGALAALLGQGGGGGAPGGVSDFAPGGPGSNPNKLPSAQQVGDPADPNADPSQQDGGPPGAPQKAAGAPGGQPSPGDQQGPQPAQDPLAGLGGPPRQPPGMTPQGVGGEGDLGGAGGLPLPVLVQMAQQQLAQQQARMAQMQQQIARRYGGIGAGRYPSPFRGPFSPQSGRESLRQTGVSAHPGSGYPPPRHNWFQHAYPGQDPPHPNEMRQLNTPAGRIAAHPLVAHDIGGLTNELRQHGFPFERNWGSYNRRRMRWGPEWSSHAWGSAFDINDQDGPLSPAVRNWIMNNQGLWKQLLARYNFSQPLAGADGVSGKDPAHIEWMGPRQQPTQLGGGSVNRPDPVIPQEPPLYGRSPPASADAEDPTGGSERGGGTPASVQEAGAPDESATSDIG